jgi:hypothetical protein
MRVSGIWIFTPRVGRVCLYGGSSPAGATSFSRACGGARTCARWRCSGECRCVGSSSTTMHPLKRAYFSLSTPCTRAECVWTRRARPHGILLLWGCRLSRRWIHQDGRRHERRLVCSGVPVLILSYVFIARLFLVKHYEDVELVPVALISFLFFLSHPSTCSYLQTRC